MVGATLSEPGDYKRLWRWVFVKEEEVRKEAELCKPIIVETKLGKLEYTRKDSREQLMSLLDVISRRDTAALNLLTDSEIARVKAWLKEKDDRDKRFELDLGL